MDIKKIYIGGWYQRTTVHLSELWDFLNYQSLDPQFSQQKLKYLRQQLQIRSLERGGGLLEYIEFKTGSSIVVRIYEDGLLILSREVRNVTQDIKQLQL